MIKRNVLKKVGVFAMTVMLAAAPIMAVNAESANQMMRAAGPTDTGNEDVVVPGPGCSADSGSSAAAADNYVVTTSAGTPLVSTVPGVYAVTNVPGVAFTTHRSQLPEGLAVAVTNSSRGERAEASINDGLAILAANGVSATKGPEVDILAYINDVKTTDLNGKVTVSFGIPESFKQAGYDYAVMLIQEGGRVSILPDTKADSACITVNTSGFGVFVLVKAPAGSFTKFN